MIETILRQTADAESFRYIVERHHLHEAADTIEQLRQEITNLKMQIHYLHNATIVLRNGMGGHNHWDDTQKRGGGCTICQIQTRAKENARRLIQEAAEAGFALNESQWQRERRQMAEED